MKIRNILALAMIGLALQGCVAAGLTLASVGAGVGAGAGVEHTMNGIVYKTFAASGNEVRFAALKALDHLGMPVTVDEKSEEGWNLTATATDRTIDIEMQKLTEQTTRMRVVVNEGAIFFKDSSTGTEIIKQTSNALEEEQDAAKSADDHNRKRKPS